MIALGMLVLLCVLTIWGVSMATRATTSPPSATSRSTPGSRRSNYRRLAELYRGRTVGGGWFHAPQVDFDYGDARVSLQVGRLARFGPRYTQLVIDWPDSELDCEVRPSRLARLRRLFRRSDIRTGVAWFDREFIVRGNNPQRIRELLTGGMQHGLQRLRELRRDRPLHVVFANGQLCIRKRGKLRDYNLLSWFVALGLELYDQALLVERTELKFVAPQPGEERVPVCKVCGEETLEQTVYCRRCRTPHHRDCWRYFGACSVYACGETRYLTAHQQARQFPHRVP